MRTMRRGFLFALLIVAAIVVSAGQVAAKESDGKLIIYANNSDDDTLKIGLYIDGTYRRSTWVGSGDSRYVSYYYLEPGEHEIKVVWSDPDVCESRYEKTFTVWMEKGETKRLVASTDRNEEVVTCAVKMLPCELKVVVKNLDDDDLWVDMRLDKYSRIKEIKSGLLKNYGTYRLGEGAHTVKLEWYEPDSYKMVSKTETIYLEFGEETRMTFYVDRYTFSREYTGFLRDL